MKLDVYQELNPGTAEVEQARKQVHYTISVIGSAEDHARWKAQQEVLEAAYQAKMIPIRAQHALDATQMVAAGAGDTASRKLSPEERAEVMYTAQRNIADQRQEPHRFVTEAQNQAERLKSLNQVFVPEVVPPRSIGDRITHWMADFISKAFEK